MGSPSLPSWLYCAGWEWEVEGTVPRSSGPPQQLKEAFSSRYNIHTGAVLHLLLSLGLPCENLPGIWSRLEMNSALVGSDSKTLPLLSCLQASQTGSIEGCRSSQQLNSE